MMCCSFVALWWKRSGLSKRCEALPVGQFPHTCHADLQDLEVFLTGKKNTSKCLPGLADSAVPSFEPAAKRLRTEDGAVAGDQRHLRSECAGKASALHTFASGLIIS